MSMHTLQQQLHDSKFMKGVLVLVAAAMFVTAYAGLGNNIPNNRPTDAPTASPDAIVATVAGEPIHRAEYDLAVKNIQNNAMQYGQNITLTQQPLVANAALERLVDQKLFLHLAKTMNIAVSDAEIQAKRTQEIKEGGIAGKVGLKDTASEADIDAALAKNGAPPLTKIFPDDDLRQAVTLEKMQKALASQVTVTEKDARDSFQQWHTRHILIDNKKRSDDQAKVEAEKILAMAKAPGANFADLAKKYSDDPGTKASGGDDKWIDETTQYVPEFKKAAFTLAAGQVTPELVKSPQFGYFIIKCDEVRSNLPKDFDKNKAKYISQVQEQRRSTHEQDTLQKMKDEPTGKPVIADPELRADKTMSDVMRETDQTKRDTDYKSALADYQKALAAKSTSYDTASINAQLATIYGALHQVPQQIAALKKAVDTSRDADLSMQLGNLYVQQKQPELALPIFQAASDRAWDNPQVHQQLLMAYLQMKRPDLVSKEQQWVATYEKNQKAAQSLPTGPPTGGVTMQPQAGQPQVVSVKPTVVSTKQSPKPAAKPTQ